MSELAKQRKEESEWSAEPEIKFLSRDNIMNGPKNVVLCTKIHLISVLREVIYKSRSLKNSWPPILKHLALSCHVVRATPKLYDRLIYGRLCKPG